MAEVNQNRPIVDVAVATKKDDDADQPEALHLSDAMRTALEKYPSLDSLTSLFNLNGAVTIGQVELVQAWLSLHQAERVRPHQEKTWGREAGLVNNYLNQPNVQNLSFITSEGRLRAVLENYNNSQQGSRLQARQKNVKGENAGGPHQLVELFNRNYQDVNSMLTLIETIRLIPPGELVGGVETSVLVGRLELLRNRWNTLRIEQAGSIFRSDRVFSREKLLETVKKITEIQDDVLVKKILSLLEPEPKPKK